MKPLLKPLACGALLFVVPALSFASCGAAFCLVNTDWGSQGVWTEPGVRADVRYEYIDLDQPRNGRDRVGVGQIPRDHDEVQTVNRNVVTAIDYGFSPVLSFSLALPMVDRDHRHIHNDPGAAQIETWQFRKLGDVRLQGRYQLMTGGDDAAHLSSAGVIFGVKLPTGKHDVANGEGEVAERTLQPGTGTTDLVIGAYYQAALPLHGASWFARAAATLPANSRDHYKPGKSLGLDGGYRYELNDNVALVAQANFSAKDRDSGAEAEPEDSGSRTLSVSPGIVFTLGRNAQLYAFVQKPVYQSVNGVQLTASWSWLMGVSARF